MVSKAKRNVDTSGGRGTRTSESPGGRGRGGPAGRRDPDSFWARLGALVDRELVFLESSPPDLDTLKRLEILSKILPKLSVSSDEPEDLSEKSTEELISSLDTDCET